VNNFESHSVHLMQEAIVILLLKFKWK